MDSVAYCVFFFFLMFVSQMVSVFPLEFQKKKERKEIVPKNLSSKEGSWLLVHSQSGKLHYKIRSAFSGLSWSSSIQLLPWHGYRDLFKEKANKPVVTEEVPFLGYPFFPELREVCLPGLTPTFIF